MLATIKNILSKYGWKGTLELVGKMADARVLSTELQDVTAEDFSRTTLAFRNC